MLCGNDNSFGPGADCRDLDFTLAFEQCILSILPDALFIVLAALRLVSVVPRSVKLARFGLLGGFKAFTLLAVASSTMTTMVVEAMRRDELLTTYTVPAAALTLTASIFLTVLTHYEHRHSLFPSSLAICYTAIKIIFNGAIIRTHTATGFAVVARPTYITLAVSMAAYFVVLMVELVEKRSLFLPKYQNVPKESSTSFISRSFFTWLLPLMWRGRSAKLTLSDLTDIPTEYKAQESRKPLEDALKSSNPQSSTFLLVATMKAFAFIFFAPVLPRLLILAATFCQPLIVNKMLEYVSDPKSTDQVGWALVGGFVIIYGVITLATAIYWEKVYALVVQFRGALVGSIYAKTLRLASHSSRPLGSGVGSTYMSVDVERITEGVEFLHEMWAAFVSIPIAVAILYFQAGWAAFTPLIVIVILLGVVTVCGAQLGRLQANWSKQTDVRIKLLSSIVNQLLPIKMSNYENILEKKVFDLRALEMKKAGKFYNMVSFTAALSNGAASLCVLITLGTYSALLLKEGRVIGVTEIFTVFITVNLLNGPLNIIGQVLPDILAAYASLLRIQSFLLLDEKPATSSPEEKNSNVIKLQGSFSLAKDMKPILKDINVNLAPGKLHMCVGPVASGKTTLLSSFLGETCLLSGTWSVPSALQQAYAAQDAFIMPGTVKENILFGSLFHQEHYDAVIAACALEPDFERLPFGDETKLGGKGATVSGGQKQRIGLARAVYGAVSVGAEVTLLDDPLSALDAETEAHVFASLFGPRGLLVGKTVVLVTHNVQHLSHADHVLVLDDGSITLQGTFEEIKQSGYDLAHLVASRKGPQAMAEQDEKLAEGQVAPVATKEKKVDDTEDDETAEQYTGGGFTPYMFYFHAGGRQRTIIFLSLLLVVTIVRLGTQGFLKNWSESQSTDIIPWILGYMGFAFGVVTCTLICFLYFANSFVARAATNIHASETKALLYSPTTYFMSVSAGRILNRFSQDIFTIDFTFPIAFLNSAAGTLNLFGTLILVFIPTPWLALSAPPLALLYWFLVKFYLATSKQLQQLEAASKSPLYTTFGTTLGGLETIRAFKRGAFFQEQNDFSLDASQGPFHFRFAGVRFLRTSLSAVTLFISVGLAALSVGLRRSTDPAFLGIALSNLSSLTQALSMVLLSYSMVENGTVSIQRIREVCLVAPEEDTGSSSGLSKLTPKESWPSRGSVVFQDVTLKYQANLEPALQGLTFKIKPGQKVGICGRTGSGKSSTIQALFRMVHHSLQSGHIFIDGADISLLPLSMVRKSMSLVAQDPFLLHATLRENLDLEGTCTDEQIWAALDKVGMKEAVERLEMKGESQTKADDTKSAEKTDADAEKQPIGEQNEKRSNGATERSVEKIVDKLSFVVEDSGSFSRGQRQLLCMARVLLRKRRIVILDEASSSMDIRTDEKIREVINTELHDQTVISVAHRIATIINFDLILVMDKGQIIESGAPEDLLAKSDSQFRRLAQSQGLVDHAHDNDEIRPADEDIADTI